MESEVPRVLHLVISLAHGGLERLVVDWTNARNRQHPGSTRVACLDAPGELAALVQGEAFCACAKRSTFPWDRAAVARLRQYCHGSAEKGSIDLVHSHDLAAQQYAVLSAWGTRIAHVYTQHGPGIYYAGLRNRVRSRILSALCGRLVAVSESTRDTMVRAAWIPRRRIRVIPNGVTPHASISAVDACELRARFGIPPAAWVIGSVGRLYPVKGYDRLLPAFQYVLSHRPASRDVRLLLIGDGPERRRLEEQSRLLGLGAHVVFAGYQPEPRRFLDLMDVFVLPSRSEGLSVALLEAMSAGCPAMVTDVGENRRVIADGEAGWLLPSDETKWGPFILTQAIYRRNRPGALEPSEAAGDESGRARKVIAAAEKRVRDVYGAERTLSSYEEEYRALVLP